MLQTAPQYAALRWEWYRLRRRVGFWVVAGIAALFVVGTLAGVAIVARLSPFTVDIPSHGYATAVSETLSRLGPLLGIVLASFLFGSDFGWGTWRTLVARGLHRRWTLISKWTLASLTLLAVWVAAWCIAAAVGLVQGDDSWTPVEGALFDIPDGWAATAAAFFASLPVALAYLALAALLCVAGRSSTLGVGLGIAIVVAESVAYPLANTIVGALYNFELIEYTRWTLWGVSRGLMGRDELSAVWFLPALLVYVAAFCGLSLLVFGKRDVDSGNG